MLGTSGTGPTLVLSLSAWRGRDAEAPTPAKGRWRALAPRSRLPGEAGCQVGLTPSPASRLSAAEGATSGAQARAAPPARSSEPPFPPPLSAPPGHMPSATPDGLRSQQAEGAQGVGDLPSQGRRLCRETGCRRAGAARRDAGPSTASVPTGCSSCRAGPWARRASRRGRWGRWLGPAGFARCVPET